MAINQTQQVTSALVEAYGIATEKRNEFLTPEHLLAGFLKDRDFWEALKKCGQGQELEENLSTPSTRTGTFSQYTASEQFKLILNVSPS